LNGKYANRKWMGIEFVTGDSICIGLKTVSLPILGTIPCHESKLAFLPTPPKIPFSVHSVLSAGRRAAVAAQCSG
jgi:hypothetical protein